MRSDHGSFDEQEWTAEERARFSALSREHTPPPELERRTTHALRDRGLLGRRRISARVVVGLLLAASLVFAAGALVGYAAAARRPAPAIEPSVASTRSVAQIDTTDSATPRTRHVVWY
jgi:hypothetical protein